MSLDYVDAGEAPLTMPDRSWYAYEGVCDCGRVGVTINRPYDQIATLKRFWLGYRNILKDGRRRSTAKKLLTEIENVFVSLGVEVVPIQIVVADDNHVSQYKGV